MDYDDNDFQGQNLHLAGEGSSKVSPVLHPYALPKFDFDDSLQGHLRFDSLVESEVFLGITSQEDNQWIEEYSRGSSGIEFSSSAAESRRNNVWSEATSSESVEMLLKSVGQEERIVGETIIQELDACDEPGTLTQIMDPNLKQDVGNDYVSHTPNASVAGEFPEEIPVLNVSSEYEQSPVKFTTKSQDTLTSGGELDSIVTSDKPSLLVVEERIGKKCDDVNQKEAENLVDESVDNKFQDPSISKVEFGNVDSAEKVDASIEELNDQESLQLVPENSSGLSSNISSAMAEDSIRSEKIGADDPMGGGALVVETGACSMEKSISVVSKVESVEKPSVEVSIAVNEEHISLLPDGCSAPLCSAEPCQDIECAVIASPTCSKVNQELKDNMHEELTAAPNARNVEMQAVQEGDTESGIPGSPESNVSYLSKIMHTQSHSVELTENDVGRDGQRFASDTPMVSADKNPAEMGEESSINNVDTHLTIVYSSAELVSGQVLNEDVIAGNNNASKVQRGDSNVDDQCLPAEPSVSMQVDHEIRSCEPGMEQDVTFNEKVDARLPSECADAEIEVVGALDSKQKVESFTSAEGSKAHIAIAQNLETDVTARVEQVSATESDKFLSPDTSDGVQLLPGSVIASDIVTDDQPKSPILGVSLLHQDSDEKAEAGYPSKEISLNETSQVGLVVKCVSDVSPSVGEKDAAPDCDGKDVHGTDGHCAPLVENCNASPTEQAAEANAGSQECFKTLEMSPLPCDSSIYGGNDAEAGRPLDTTDSIAEGSHRVEPLNLAVNMSNEHQVSVVETCPPECDANRMVQDGGSSASLDKPQSFPPSGTGSIGVSSSTKDKEEVGKGAMFENATLSKVTDDMGENTQSVSSNSAGKEEKSFTFKVSTGAGLEKTDKGWQPFPVIQACDSSMIMEESSINPCSSRVDPKKSQEASLVQTPSGATSQVGTKGNSERKTRRKPVGKESAKKSNRLKETTPLSHSGRVEKTSMSLTPLATGQVIQFEELKPNEKAERIIAKPSGPVSVPTSNLPDLNNSTSIFQQPFTDNQQVQLRAQILVYGSLISGTPPDEAHMIAAFGQSDGGRRAWDAAWRACLERLHVQKAQSNNSDTPMQSRSDLKDAGSRAPDQGIKHGSVQSKVLSSPIGGASNKSTASPVVTPMIPLSSPLWSISTPSCDGLQSSNMPRNTLLDYHQALSPLHPYQTPPVQNFGGLNPSWLSQGPFPGQWVASSPISAFNVGARLSALPITEAVKLTPVKESGAPGIKHTSSIPVVHSAGSGAPSISDVQKTTVSSGQPSSDLKSRKRKKITATAAVSPISIPSQPQVTAVSAAVFQLPQVPRTEGHTQMSLVAQNQPDRVTAPVVSGLFPTSVAVSTPASVTSRSDPAKFVSSVSHASTHDNPRSGDQMEKFVISEETLSKVEESKLQAEEAAVHAAAAVSHCQEVWSKLEKQKNSGLVSDDEAKLASSAVSMVAAAAVSKAAAAAAKLASNVAEQARLMADEVFLSSRTDNFDQSSMICLPAVVNKFDKATPASILKGGERSNRPISIISAAKEAARRRVEAASAASKHAENLDAIVKAAELAAEAVSQAGKIVAMGDPLPLSELVEAGPEGYWKTPQLASKPEGVVLGSINNSYDEKSDTAPNLSDKGIQTLKHGLSPQEKSGDISENQKMEIGGISSLITSHEKDAGAPRTRKNPDLSKTIGVIPESEVGSINTSTVSQDIAKSTSGTEEDNIKEGCLVEVYKDDGKYKGAWLAANVLSLKDGKAFVCYTEIQSDEGSGQLKEWVPLEIMGSEVPKVRIAHPMTTMRSEGTRKRRRTAVTDYTWSIGDRVDVWILDCWHEGVVAETNKIDVTSLTVKFPAQGETSVVRSWHLRPTLTWKDGQWIEWSTSKGGNSSQGDTPQEKRLKLGSPTLDGNKKDKSLENADLAKLGMHEVPGALPLSSQDSLFNVGKSTRDENKLDTQRTMRSGLQKEGPRVIFGVPKPGKKQKFMDVSKHYVAEGSTKNNTANDSVKFARYLMPQAPGPRGWRNSSRSDAKEKQPAEHKAKVLKSRKPPIPSSRTVVQKENNLASFRSTARDAIMMDKARGSVSDDEKSGHENQIGSSSKSNTEDASEGPGSDSSLALPSDALKTASTSNAKTERLNKGKLAPGGGKASKAEVADRSIPEVVEPRRSNRRIQPTSRLLEGLQSSLTISKMPSASHGGQRTQSKPTSKGNTNHS